MLTTHGQLPSVTFKMFRLLSFLFYLLRLTQKRRWNVVRSKWKAKHISVQKSIAARRRQIIAAPPSLLRRVVGLDIFIVFNHLDRSHDTRVRIKECGVDVSPVSRRNPGYNGFHCDISNRWLL